MLLTARLPLLPADAHEVSESLAILHDDERIVFFNAAGPIFSCRRDDRTALRLAAVTVVEQGLAGTIAVAKAVSLHRTTLFRDGRKFAEGGVEGLVIAAVDGSDNRILTTGNAIGGDQVRTWVVTEHPYP